MAVTPTIVYTIKVKSERLYDSRGKECNVTIGRKTFEGAKKIWIKLFEKPSE